MFWVIVSLISAANGLEKACTARAGIPLIKSCDARDYAILGAEGQCITPSMSGDECAYQWSCSAKGLTVTIYDGASCEANVFSSASIAPTPDDVTVPECFSMSSCQFPDAIGSIRQSEFAKCCLNDHQMEDEWKHFGQNAKENIVNKLHGLFHRKKKLFKHHG